MRSVVRTFIGHCDLLTFTQNLTRVCAGVSAILRAFLNSCMRLRSLRLSGSYDSLHVLAQEDVGAEEALVMLRDLPILTYDCDKLIATAVHDISSLPRALLHKLRLHNGRRVLAHGKLEEVRAAFVGTPLHLRGQCLCMSRMAHAMHSTYVSIRSWCERYCCFADSLMLCALRWSEQGLCKKIQHLLVPGWKLCTGRCPLRSFFKNDCAATGALIPCIYWGRTSVYSVAAVFLVWIFCKKDGSTFLVPWSRALTEERHLCQWCYYFPFLWSFAQLDDLQKIWIDASTTLQVPLTFAELSILGKISGPIAPLCLFFGFCKLCTAPSIENGFCVKDFIDCPFTAVTQSSIVMYSSIIRPRLLWEWCHCSLALRSHAQLKSFGRGSCVKDVLALLIF